MLQGCFCFGCFGKSRCGQPGQNGLDGLAASRLLPEAVESRLTGLALGPKGVEREMHHERQTSRRFALQSIVEELNKQGIGFLVTIDEIDPHGEELLSFIDMYQHFVADGRDVALLMAGLPGQVSALLIDKNVSFIRRAFQRTLGSISRYEVEESLYSTIVDNGKQIDDDALSMAVEAARGFAFAIQLVGYYLWRASDGHTLITVEDARHANVLFQRELVRAIVEPTLRETAPRELEYVMAMAEDEGPSSTSAIARRMGISMSNASNLRRRLIERGAITELRHGVVDFDVPMTREYLRTLKG